MDVNEAMKRDVSHVLYMRQGGTVPPGEATEFVFHQQMGDQVYVAAQITDGGEDTVIEQVRIGRTLVHDVAANVKSTRDDWPVAVTGVVRVRNNGKIYRNVLVDILHTKKGGA